MVDIVDLRRFTRDDGAADNIRMFSRAGLLVETNKVGARKHKVRRFCR
jgi:hypothetical protein